MFESVKSFSVSLDEIVKRQRCVQFVCVTVIKVVKDVIQVKDVISVFTFRQIFRNRTFLWI